MAIRWDSPLARALASELAARLERAKLRAIRLDRARRELTLFFRSDTLHWSLHPDRGWVILLPPTTPSSDALPVPARLVEVEAPPDERRVRLVFRRLRGAPRRVEVVVELYGNPWNALILEGEEGMVRSVLHPRPQGARPLVPGIPYRPPPPPTRWGLEAPAALETTFPPQTGGGSHLRQESGRGTAFPRPAPGESPLEAFLRTAREAGDPRLVLDHLAYASPLNVSALLAAPPFPPLAPEDVPGPGGGPGPELRPGEALPPLPPLSLPWPATGVGLWGPELWKRLHTLKDPIPCVLETTRGKQPYPYPLYGFKFTQSPSLLEAMLQVARSEGPLLVGREAELRAALEGELQRARRRVRALEEELASAEEPGPLRDLAHLLLARLGEIPRGAGRLVLRGFGGEGVRVELDPSLSPLQNAEALFRRAARAEAARERLPELLARARGRVEELEAALKRGDPGEAPAAFPEEGAPASHRPKRDGPPAETGEKLPYRSFRSSGGREIRVGKGARENDALTFHHSDPDDIWLHARDAAGAHVILRWKGEGSPPARDLEEAAILAALASRARHSAVVPVDWTRRKYVRKPRKSPPGVVLPERVRTLFVRPDPSLPERLAPPDAGGSYRR